MGINQIINNLEVSKAFAEVLKKSSQLTIIWIIVFFTTVTTASYFTDQSFFEYFKNEILVVSTEATAQD